MEIRRARTDELSLIRSFYHELIDTSPYVPMWKKDIYPNDELLSEALCNGELYIGLQSGKIISALIAETSNEYIFLNLLGVLPEYTRCGFAKAMVSFVIKLTHTQSLKGVRLDVLEGNTAAEKLYASMGFQPIGCYEEFYERTGKMVFKIFEYKFV